MNEKGTDFVIIPMADFVRLTDTQTRYAILESHIRAAIRNAAEHNKSVTDEYKHISPKYETGLFQAVIGCEEGDVE